MDHESERCGSFPLPFRRHPAQAGVRAAPSTALAPAHKVLTNGKESNESASDLAEGRSFPSLLTGKTRTTARVHDGDGCSRSKVIKQTLRQSPPSIRSLFLRSRSPPGIPLDEPTKTEKRPHDGAWSWSSGLGQIAEKPPSRGDSVDLHPWPLGPSPRHRVPQKQAHLSLDLRWL